MRSIDHNQHNLQKAETEKYVYHLSYKSKRQYIESDLLRGFRSVKPKSNRGLVFAHNTNQVTLDWYWMCLDIWEKQFCKEDEEYYPYRDQLRYFVNKHYDIWRIDNDIAKKNWYIDFIGFNDCFGDVKKDYFVKCFGNISKDALKLCVIDDDVIETIATHNGSMHKTYYNQIIPRDEYITKHGFAPELENEITRKNQPLLELVINDEKGFTNTWKKLKYKNISIKDAA